MKLMNRSSIIILIGILTFIVSCQKLDKKPPNILSDDQIFANEAGTDAYLAQVYRKLPIEDFSYRPDGRNDGVGDVGFNLHHELFQNVLLDNG